MNNSPDIQKSNKLSECCEALCRLRLQHDYDMSLSVIDERPESSSVCTHHTKGSVSIPVWKILAVVGVIITFCALMRRTTSLFCK